MGQTGQRQHGFETESKGDSQDDSFAPLLREIARDSTSDAECVESVSILPKRGEVVEGKYQIDERLGSGGMGTVFSATHLELKRRVAIKWMLPLQSIKKESIRRFRREAEAAARIRHPNVVHIYDIGQHKGGYYLVMELLNGEPLSALIEARYRFSYCEAIELLMPVMRAVAAFHAEGVIHRDLKPGNIFLCWCASPNGREPKVLDFGVSKLLAQNNQPDLSLTTDNTLLGTLCYVAPEQVQSNRKVDHRADIYSLGVLLYELITGRLPIEAKGYSETIVEITTTGKPKAPIELKPELPRELSDIVMKSIARNPDHRFANVREFALALEPFAPRIRFEPTENVVLFRPTPLSVNVKNRLKNSRLAQFTTLAIVIASTVWMIVSLLSTTQEKGGFEASRTNPNLWEAKVQRSELSALVRDIPVRSPTILEPRIFEPRDNSATKPTKTSKAVNSENCRPIRSEISSARKTRAFVDSTASKAGTEAGIRAAPEKSAGERRVTFRNSLRATVKVALRCPGFSNELYVPAKEQIVATIPREDCQVVCSSSREPVCNIKLQSNALVFRID